MIKLYNDPYKAIAGGKHPQALGQPASVVWKDIWKDIEPMLKQVMEKDEGTYVESQLLIMERYGYREETYFTFSYWPVPGDNGGTAGMICYSTADTERIITERSLQTLKELGALTKKKTLEEVYTAAAKVLEMNNKDFPCAVIYQISEEEKVATALAYAGIDKEHPELPNLIDLQNPGISGRNLSAAVIENKMVSEAWKAMVHPDDWTNVMNSWEKDSQAGLSSRYEVRLKNKEGEYRWHYATGEPVKDQYDKITKWIGALTDIHVQKTFSEKLEKEVAQRTEDLVKANKGLESFNYIASHDL